MGFKVNIQEGAGAKADFADQTYKDVGASIVSRDDALKSDLILKVRAPSL